jgi:hypothetical protein
MLSRESLILLVLAKLLNWQGPPPNNPGDPWWLTAKNAEAIATEAIHLLKGFLPGENAEMVAAAIKSLPRQQVGDIEESLISFGNLGGTSSHSPGDGAPGCCVRIGGRLVCVRAHV